MLFNTVFIVVCACGTSAGNENRAMTTAPPGTIGSPSSASGELSPWPADWASYVGRQVRISGTAADAKMGAILLGDGNQSIWMDGMDAWPPGFYEGGDKGKRVCVIGTVIEKNDLPVFVQKKDEPIMQGIPVPEGTDLEKARKRYLIAKPVFCP